MTRNSLIRIALAGIASLTIIILIYMFLFGKLFAYSSVVVGFSKHELSNTVICVQHETVFDGYSAIDAMIPAVEEFHELQFTEKPRIFIFRDTENYLRRAMTKARFCAYPNGSLVISPLAIKEAKEGKISLDIYLKHELSHTLLYQHMGIIAAYNSYPQWLMEGIAVYSTKQMGTSWYPSKDETYAYIKQGNFMPPEYFKTKKEDGVKLNVKYRITFMYSEFACIVDHLIATRGKERFLFYMKSLLKSNDHDRVFKEIYGIDFDDYLQEFRESIEMA